MKTYVSFFGQVLLGLAIFLGVEWDQAQAAAVTVGSWQPLYQGVDLASGRQQKQLAGEQDHQVLCLRVDLTDPDVQLLTTPKCTNCSVYETLAQNTSHFVAQYGVQAAVNGGFYMSSSGPNDVPLGTPEDVLGLAISEGTVVSPANNPSYAAALLFTTNKEAFFIPNNSPGTNTAGIYTAISGNRALLVNGVNVQTPIPNDLDPRTAIGLSADRRYLYLMTIDGRQPGWSDGADFYNAGEWLLRFGASDGINVDGGGSTTMVTTDCESKPVRINRSSFVYTYGRERIIGHNFGVRARPLPSLLTDLQVEPGSATALIQWRTDVESTAVVEYGTNTTYGSISPLDTALVRNHAVTLTGLVPGVTYYFRATSSNAVGELSDGCSFTTVRSVSISPLVDLTKSWRYTSNNVGAADWKSLTYDDSGWMGEGPALLYVLESSAMVAPRNTAIPPLTATTTIPRTYYFRTHFNFSGSPGGVSLIFSNYVDDGAVFYLNGSEIRRLRMPAAPTPITYATTATGVPCANTQFSGDANTACPDVFTVSGAAINNNLREGDNVLAVEVHNFNGADLVFGSAVLTETPQTIQPTLNFWMENGVATLSWNAEGFTLQHSTDLSSSANWSDVPGPVTASPYRVTSAESFFYRLRAP